MTDIYDEYYGNQHRSVSLRDISNEALDSRLTGLERIVRTLGATGTIESSLHTNSDSALEERLNILEKRCAKLEQIITQFIQDSDQKDTQVSQMLDKILGE